MNEMDLGRCVELMRIRDRWQLNTEDYNKKNLFALADEVPGLVEEVRRLNLQNREMLAALIALADRVSVRFGEIIKYEPVATGRYLDAAYEVIGKAKATEKPLSDTCENFKQDGTGYIGSRYCSAFEANAQEHASTCQFAVKRKGEPWTKEHCQREGHCRYPFEATCGCKCSQCV